MSYPFKKDGTIHRNFAAKLWNYAMETAILEVNDDITDTEMDGRIEEFVIALNELRRDETSN